MSRTTPDANHNLVAKAIGEMTTRERTRLEVAARAAGLTLEQAVVKIVSEALTGEAR
ncbi:hypothetical protein [Pseudomonas sp. PA15(2017)]|uniref:hypothetical protein n=1 Tax=Pseudomonas sp. PA15(2017) TaxID=1932111 RepID=UPI00143C15B4|nr:hypothetical protein [Pseudomonas sp. PA15(2017)]